jgi:tetratricopeptide (TPR) repeat protein
MSTPAELASGKRLPVGWILLAAAAVIAAVAITFLLPDSDNGGAVTPGPEGRVLTNEDQVEIVNLRNLGIAHLENGDLEEAIAELTRLAELLPAEQLPRRNLAIATIMQVDPESNGHIDRSREPDRYSQALEQANQSVTDLRTRNPDDAVASVLSARLYRLTEQTAQAVEFLRSAASLDPENPATAYELFETARDSRDESQTAIAALALARVWHSAPQNLTVFKERLLFLAREKSAQENGGKTSFKVDASDLKDMFQAAGPLLRPFAKKIENFARVNVLELAEQGAAAVDSGDWNTVLRNASVIGNVITPEVATQTDRKLVRPHHLEFLIRDFSDEFLRDAELPLPPFPDPIDVTLTPIATALADQAGIGAARIADMTLDRQQDIVTVDDSTVRVWGQADGSWFEAFSATAGPGLRGLCLFDIERDAADTTIQTDTEPILYAEADLDAIVFGASGITVLHNNLDKDSGQRSFVAVEQSAEFAALRDVLAVLPVDFDHDGDLDLCVSTEAGLSLWLNLDDSTFAANSQYSVLPPADAQIHQMIAVDWDRNVSVDIVCLGNGTAGYLQNVLHGQLRWQPFFDEGKPLSDATSLTLLDADANFSWDLIAGGTDSSRLFKTSNPDAGVTRFDAPADVSQGASDGVTTADLDNDGFIDLLTWHGQTLSALRGGPLGQFEPVEKLTSELPSTISGCDVADVDSDGDLDVLVTCAESVELLQNDGGNTNHWLDLPIRGEAALEAQRRSERVNLHGIGSFIELQAGMLYQPRVVTGPSTHFGLGKLDDADNVRVVWTNGVPEHVIQPRHQQVIVLQQNLKGSCPYLYTWDGEKFAFYTDCLWAAPIGLQPVEGSLLPPREWEYLKVDGEALKPRDGEYVLKLTEELWEIGYFDSVQLLAVDHPADVEIYSNEKVGPPSISQHKVHTVRSPQTPAAAVDQAGRNVLPKIEKQDDVWLQCWDRRIKQGLTEPHFLELDLGQLQDPQQITLFLTGWIRPTDTSLNVAITQRPDLEPTSPPSISVPDKDDNWISVRPYMGFPGGKTKTIAVDLSGAFPTDDYRVRISTTMEIYWDHAFFTVDESSAEVRTTELPLKTAALGYRGFSKRLPHSGNGLGPESYDYSTVSQRAHWPPMEGRLTGYGNVLELLSATDQRQVTLGAGDELELRFAAEAPPLPDGWTRDFILHNVGWDKDADLNTVFGQSVDPLPFAGMVGYPDISGSAEQQPFANQTRSQSRPAFWREFFDAARHQVTASR